MTPDNGKSGLGAVLDEPAPKAKGEDEYASGKRAASDAVMAAMKSGDSAAFESALSDFVTLCM